LSAKSNIGDAAITPEEISAIVTLFTSSNSASVPAVTPVPKPITNACSGGSANSAGTSASNAVVV